MPTDIFTRAIVLLCDTAFNRQGDTSECVCDVCVCRKFAGSRGELVSGPLVVLLEQAVVPVSMVVSMVLLGSRYQLSHTAGAALVITGICASTVPTLVHASGSKVWAALLVLGGECIAPHCVPA